jgi:hypothetical protein
VRFHSGWSLQSLPLIFKLPTPSHWKMPLFSPPQASARVTPKGTALAVACRRWQSTGSVHFNGTQARRCKNEIFPDLNPDSAGVRKIFGILPPSQFWPPAGFRDLPPPGGPPIPIWPAAGIRGFDSRLGNPDLAGIGRINPDSGASGNRRGFRNLPPSHWQIGDARGVG